MLQFSKYDENIFVLFTCSIFMLALKCYHILQSNQNAEVALYCTAEITQLYLQTEHSQQMTQDGLGWKHNYFMATWSEVSEPVYSTDFGQIPSKIFDSNISYLGNLVGNLCFLHIYLNLQMPDISTFPIVTV